MDRSLLAALPLVIMLGLGGCSSEPTPAPAVEDAPIVMQPGEWILTRKTTGYNTPSVTPEEYQEALRQVRDDKICLAIAPDGVPDTAALAGAEGTDCTYKDKLARNGRLIVTLACKAGRGTSDIMAEGNYTADTMTLGTTMTKMQGGQPVLRTTHDLTGKRIGDCPAPG
ncbi:hypothetical protein J2W40_000012 [Sphingobium xenophagum]|uniref:DUF3617 domain-containing protein n=1 Tax=Sphingobium xenophagum TaxID=121428 RepID=A0ABU1WV92_SPHXE|nr:DUF3617 domain-containing protein [Sphingobium xenophagum]MDR7153218.1 hypothetical protein [Sphingobium xenophagum]